MFARIANGWELAKASLNVLRLDKELMLFPLISGFCCLLVLASFAVPLWNTEYFQVVMDEQQAPQNPLAYVIMFAFYFVNYFVIIFFNSALVACAVLRFQGQNPTLSDGLGAASRRLPQILGWALVAASVGMILKVIESKSERVGQIVTGLIGMAWSITTFFVVPVLVVEKADPMTAFKRSASIIRKTWGEALSANFGIGIITFLCCLPCFAVIALGAYLIGTAGAVVGGVVIGIGVLSLLLVSLISTTLDTIVLAALYLYAADGTVPQYFDASMLSGSFARK